MSRLRQVTMTASSGDPDMHLSLAHPYPNATDYTRTSSDLVPVTRHVERAVIGGPRLNCPASSCTLAALHTHRRSH